MHEDLGNYRKIYKKEQLLESGVPENPMELFQRWFYEIESCIKIEKDFWYKNPEKIKIFNLFELLRQVKECG